MTGETHYCNARLKGRADDLEKEEPSEEWAGDGYCKKQIQDTRRCKDHGGHGGRPPTHGLYSAKRKRLRKKMRHAAGQEQKGDLSAEVSVLRALLADYLESLEAPDSDSLGDVSKITSEIRRTIDTMHQMMLRERPTKEEVQQLTSNFADILRRYVPERHRSDALDELRSAAITGGQHRLEGRRANAS
jgi:hypothetical protein